MASEEPVVLVDSNVLLDVLTDDVTWSSWSGTALADVLDHGAAAINPLIYAEVSVRFDRIEDVDLAVPESVFRRERLPYNAGFVAAKAFLAYRQRGGPRTAPLPDFYIGAHAAVAGLRLLTRDARRYRPYFPKIELIAPSTR